MRYNPERHHRRSIRLRGYDYSKGGVYVVTILTANREHLFGEIVDAEMQYSDYGMIAAREWEKSAVIRAEIDLDAWIIMPNHVHGIVVLTEDEQSIRVREQVYEMEPAAIEDAQGRRGTMNKSLSSFVQGYKAAVTTRINTLRQVRGEPVWQRNYYERIVRDADEYNRFRKYIINNPAYWERDKENRNRVKMRRS
jgi:putative transposase